MGCYGRFNILLGTSYIRLKLINLFFDKWTSLEYADLDFASVMCGLKLSTPK